MDLNIKRKERKALNSSLYSSTHRNARTIKLVSLRVRRIGTRFFYPSRQAWYIITHQRVYHRRRRISSTAGCINAFATMIYNG